MIAFAALLSVATLFGGMIFYSFGFAPFVFSALPAADAGRLIRKAFPWYYLFVIAIAALGGLMLLPLNAPTGALLLAIAAGAVYARQGLMPQINAARDGQLQGDPAAKRRFTRLHGLSVALNFVQLLAVGYALHRFL